MNIGIIGKGFVGSAVHYGFSTDPHNDFDIKIYDKNPKLSSHSLEETINHSEIVFVSVPTPANLDGSINLEIINDILSEINNCYDGKSIILLRSTLIPGTSSMFSKKYSKLKIVFNPEFLTERSAKFDFINQSRFILGGEKKLTSKVADLYRWRFGSTIQIIETTFETAELIKYMNNCFFATKVSFLNEMKQVAEKCNADWDMAIEGFISDGRIGHSHLSVPGPDGKFGFGGSCFPKDIQAMINFGTEKNLELSTLIGAWETNLKVRPEKDWEKLKGRAVVNDD